jgi:hypothetical protein
MRFGAVATAAPHANNGGPRGALSRKSKNNLEIFMKVRESNPASVAVLRRLVLTACIAGTVLGNTACSMLRSMNPLTTTMSVFNNSGRTVLVANKEVAPGRKLKFDYATGSRDRLFVFSAGCVFSYANLPAVPGKFESGSWFGADYQAQLEADGRIFLVLPGSRRPVNAAAHATQPSGFPLLPSRASGCQAEESVPAAAPGPAVTPGAAPSVPAPNASAPAGTPGTP